MRWSLALASAFALAVPVLLTGCADHERRDRGRGHDGEDLRYDDTRYGDARDGDVDESGYRDVRWDDRDGRRGDRDGLPPYDETDRATTNDEVSAPRDYTPEDTPGVGNPTTSPRGGTQRRDLNPSPRDPYRRSDIP